MQHNIAKLAHAPCVFHRIYCAARSALDDSTQIDEQLACIEQLSNNYADNCSTHSGVAHMIYVRTKDAQGIQRVRNRQYVVEIRSAEIPLLLRDRKLIYEHWMQYYKTERLK